MSNKMINIIENVFKDLKSNVIEDEYIKIQDKTLRINPNSICGDEISKILQHSKTKIFNMSHSIKCMIIFYDDCYYLMYPYYLELNEYWTCVNQESFQEGFGLIAISESFLFPYKDKSYEIYNKIFASTLSNFDFIDIACFYQKYTIIKDIPELNELIYLEDIYRLTGLFLTNNLIFTSNVLTPKTYSTINSLLCLKSSRCISSCIIRCLDSYLLDHCFLELYRCIEFLFYIQISFDITKKYTESNLNSIINLVSNREIVRREQDTLEAIIKNIDKTYVIDDFFNFLVNNAYITVPQESDFNSNKEINKCHFIALHIYDLRCKTAHLSYNHEYIPFDYKWQALIELLSNLVFNIYTDLDQKLNDICDSNNIWKPFEL